MYEAWERHEEDLREAYVVSFKMRVKVGLRGILSTFETV